MSLAIDGTPVGYTGSIAGTSQVLPALTTTQSNDVIIVSCASNGAGSITSITGGGLTFVARSTLSAFAIFEWVAVASAPLAGVVLTVNFANAALFTTMCAFGISGANTATIWDSNSGLPFQGSAPTGVDPTFSTTSAITIVLAHYRQATEASPTPGAGWTTLYAPTSGYYLCMYQIFSSAQTGTTASESGSGVGDQNGWVIDAIIPAAPNGSATIAWVV